MSLMKRVSDRDTTQTDQQVTPKDKAERPVQAFRMQGNTSTDIYALLEHIQTRILNELEGGLNTSDVASMRRTIDELLSVIMTEECIILQRGARQQLFEQVVHEILGFGPLEPLLAD